MSPLPIIPLDKANHLVYGAALACLGALHSVLLGALLCASLAVIKEVRDLGGRGQASWADLLATLAGGALVLLPLILRSL